MPRCEMCGTNEDSLTKTKISQAELSVCDSCSSLGTEVEDSKSSQKTTPAKNKTNETESTTTTETNSNPRGDNTSTDKNYNTESLESAEPLLPGYGDLIEEARESNNLSIEDLANELNEKESHLRKIESEDIQPTEDLQSKIEEYLGISLSDSSSNVDEEDDRSSSTLNVTLGDKLDMDDI